MIKKRVVLFLPVLVLIIGFTLFKLPLKKNSNPKKSTRPLLTIMGNVNMNDGIGRLSVELIGQFKNEIKTSFASSRQRCAFNDVPLDIQEFINKTKKKRMGKVIFYQDVLWLPGHCDATRTLQTIKRDDQIRIAYSMWEATRLPPEWVIILNSYFDAVAIPDSFLKEVYMNSGVKIPIFVLPLALEMKNFLREPIKTQKNTPMVFATFGTSIERKNTITLIRAFARAFGNNPDVVLKINSKDGEKDVVDEIIQEIKELKSTNIHYSQLQLKNDAYLDLFKSIDCFVSISKAEGFSIQPREAMALGIPVIATDNTAQKTLCASGLVKSVKSEISEPAFYSWLALPSGERFNCTIEEVKEALLDVYNNYNTYLSNAEPARKWAAQYDYSHLKSLYKSLLIPNQILLGNSNQITESYLMTNSEVFFNKFQKILFSNTKATETCFNNRL